jgi:hypothetical protein
MISSLSYLSDGCTQSFGVVHCEMLSWDGLKQEQQDLPVVIDFNV